MAGRHRVISEEVAELDAHLGRLVAEAAPELPRAYVARRTEEGKSKREVVRCLKRYIAREVYRVLTSIPLPTPTVSVP